MEDRYCIESEGVLVRVFLRRSRPVWLYISDSGDPSPLLSPLAKYGAEGMNFALAR